MNTESFHDEQYPLFWLSAILDFLFVLKLSFTIQLLVLFKQWQASDLHRSEVTMWEVWQKLMAISEQNFIILPFNSI